MTTINYIVTRGKRDRKSRNIEFLACYSKMVWTRLNDSIKMAPTSPLRENQVPELVQNIFFSGGFMRKLGNCELAVKLKGIGRDIIVSTMLRLPFIIIARLKPKFT